MTVRKGHVTPKEDLGLLPEFLFKLGKKWSI